MNKVLLVGRLTKDPDYKETTSGKKVSSFTIAVERMREGVDYIETVAFESTADFISKYARKGATVSIVGRWEVDSYKNKEGKTINTHRCIIEQFDIIVSKKEEKEAESQPQEELPSVDELVDDDLPF